MPRATFDWSRKHDSGRTHSVRDKRLMRDHDAVQALRIQPDGIGSFDELRPALLKVGEHVLVQSSMRNSAKETPVKVSKRSNTNPSLAICDPAMQLVNMSGVETLNLLDLNCRGFSVNCRMA